MMTTDRSTHLGQGLTVGHIEDIHDFSPLNDARPCDFSPGAWPDSLIKMVVDGRFDVGTFNGRAWPRAMVSAAIREMGRRHAMLSL